METAQNKEHKKPVKIQDLTLRDGHQSLLATRMRTEDMIPIAEKMDEVGLLVYGGLGRGNL